MPTIEIAVKNKIARQTDYEVYVCGNSDYCLLFDFDGEWDAYNVKTARLKYNGKFQEVVFTGNECPLPIINNTNNIQIGVYAGSLHTSTSAVVSAQKSILCGDAAHENPPADVYNQLLELLKKGVNDEEIADAVAQYMEEHPQEVITAGENVNITDGKITVVTTNEAAQDNTLPITSAGVHAQIGNINTLLETI